MLEILIFGGLAAFANMLGGYLITLSDRINRALLTCLLAIGAGFLLAAVFLKVIPASVGMERWQGRMEIPMLLVLGGYLLIQFFEHTVAPHFHFGEETHTHEMLHRPVMLAAVGGLAIHTFFDGVAIASGFNVSPRLGVLISIAIILHKLPEGFTVASIALASGRTIAGARWATAFVAAATLAGVAVLAAVKSAVIYALPFSAGVTLYVAASDLIPEVNKAGRGFISIVVFAGVALYYMTERMLEAFGL